MAQSDQLNSKLNLRCFVDTSDMAWVDSPAPGVQRKRLFRVGPQESGKVTSLVRYAPGSKFPSHPHPEGEEILVLSGVFSDQRGNWPAGSYLFNPEGYEHAPWSDGGCELFVRLRQAPDTQRHQAAILVEDRVWRRTSHPDVKTCDLWRSADFPDRTWLERWSTSKSVGSITTAVGLEVYVISGALFIDDVQTGAGCWLRLPAGSEALVRGDAPCELYFREGAFGFMSA